MNNVRWLSNKEFPRQLPQHALLSVTVTICSLSQEGEGSGFLSLIPSITTVGDITSEKAE